MYLLIAIFNEKNYGNNKIEQFIKSETSIKHAYWIKGEDLKNEEISDHPIVGGALSVFTKYLEKEILLVTIENEIDKEKIINMLELKGDKGALANYMILPTINSKVYQEAKV